MRHTLTFDGQEITFDAQDGSAEVITSIASDLLTKDGFVNLDVEDVKNILDGAENVTAAEGTASGEGRCKSAAQKAVKSIKGARRMMLEIMTGPEITLFEMTEAANVLMEACDEDAQVIWGHVIDESLGDSVMVSVVAAM